MLAGFTRLATQLGVSAEAVLGEWPACADQAGRADVVVCHHVVDNGPRSQPARDAVPWPLQAHRAHRGRCDRGNPRTGVVPGREDCERPGMQASFQLSNPTGYAQWIRRRLCLPPSRTAEVEAAIAEAGGAAAEGLTAEVTTLWWDIAGTPAVSVDGPPGT